MKTFPSLNKKTKYYARRCSGSSWRNAVFWLNSWRQRRVWEYLTDLGKQTLKSDLQADKHLFPDSFHKAGQSEHDHSQTSNKLVAALTAGKYQFKRSFASKEPFRR